LLTAEQERQCLATDPFAGDKDDGGFTLLSDHFVTARKAGPCATPCGEEVRPGQRVRRMTSVQRDAGTMHTIRFCEPCCAAMGLDDWEPYDERLGRGLRLARGERALREES
jgi:hypothetical protein